MKPAIAWQPNGYELSPFTVVKVTSDNKLACFVHVPSEPSVDLLDSSVCEVDLTSQTVLLTARNYARTAMVARNAIRN